jgi:hypothetical protein
VTTERSTPSPLLMERQSRQHRGCALQDAGAAASRQLRQESDGLGPEEFLWAGAFFELRWTTIAVWARTPDSYNLKTFLFRENHDRQ